jgi:hypothetical protein
MHFSKEIDESEIQYFPVSPPCILMEANVVFQLFWAVHVYWFWHHIHVPADQNFFAQIQSLKPLIEIFEPFSTPGIFGIMELAPTAIIATSGFSAKTFSAVAVVL